MASASEAKRQKVTMVSETAPFAEIGTRLLSARYELGLTQTQIASAIGVSERAYQHYECGTRLVPTHILINLGVVLSVRADFILFGTGGAAGPHPSLAGVTSPAAGVEKHARVDEFAAYRRATLATLPTDLRNLLLRHLLEIDLAERNSASKSNADQNVRRARRLKPDLSPPRYQNPDNPQQIWRGRGTKPTWLRDALASGRQLSEFLSEQSSGGGN